MLVFSTYLKKETMKSVKQFFSSQVKSICLLFTIVIGAFLTLSSCSPPCGEGNYLGTMEECSVTADATSSGGGSGGSTGGGTGGGGGTTAPTVQSVTPANSATGIAVVDNITVTFSEAMQSSSIDNTTITLNNSGAGITTAVSYSSNVATINPSAALLWNTQYTVNVSTGVKNAAGNALASAYTSSYTTAVLPIPTNVVATATSSSRIEINWDAMPGATKYKIQRGEMTGGGTISYTSSSEPSTNTMAFNGLTSSTTYYFKVRTISYSPSYQYGDYSTVVSATTN